MRTPTEHIKTLQRRVDFLKAREHRNSYDAAELGSLEWALVNLSPQSTWVGLSDEETETLIHRFDGDPHTLLDEINARLKEKNHG